NGDAFGDDGAVVQLQHRHLATRVDGPKPILKVSVISQINFHLVHIDAFFGDHNTNPARARGGGTVVKSHESFLPYGNPLKPYPSTQICHVIYGGHSMDLAVLHEISAYIKNHDM